MEKEVKVSTRHLENSKTIKLSTNTHTLIQCRAMLSDVYDTVTDVIDARYGNQQDAILEDFRSTFCDLDNELCGLIGMFIEVTSMQGNFREGCYKEI